MPGTNVFIISGVTMAEGKWQPGDCPGVKPCVQKIATSFHVVIKMELNVFGILMLRGPRRA